jgi:hypothetical protein
MGTFNAEAEWNAAKKAFEATAAKKRPGMNISKLAKFISALRAHTGLTPACKTLDKAYDKINKDWGAVDLAAKEKMLAVFEAAEADVRAKGKAYIELLKKNVENELVDGDPQGEVMRGLENMSNAVEVLLKGAKGQRLQYQTQLAGLKQGKGAGEAIKDGILLSSPQTLDKAVAGMKAMVRNIKSKPTFDTWMKELGGDPATRWATTKLKDLGTSFKKHPQLERKVGADPMEFQKKLNIYGAGWDDKWWRKTFGDEKNDKSNILKHVAEIEKQIPNIEILSTRLKDALKEMNGG